jgi:molecular chaperone DnaK
MSDDIVGIDLGTTNSEIAVYRDGRPEVLADEQGRKILPSVVGLTEAGELLVGEEARNQFLLYPERTVRSIKRRMGRAETVRMADREYAPQEISAIILKRLKEIAQARLGRPVRKTVITVPAYFSDTQRQATREAGEIAGLEVVRIINEPTAASVVRIEEGVVEVISSHGNNHLGGDDFDQKIVAHILEHLKISQAVDLSDQPRAMARILRAAETAKKHLSDHPFARIEEEYLAEVDGKPVHLSMELARHEYEVMIAPYVEETLQAIHTALRSADLTAAQVEETLLVGGATRTPMIRERLKQVFGHEPRGEVDADLCVAMGAAIQGAVIAGQDVSAVLVDVTPYTFGTSALGELDDELYPYCYIPIIPSNTPIPVRKSEVFFTVGDNQTEVDVRIFQGENRDAMQNIEIGSFRIEGLSKALAGNEVLLDLALDRDGILHVTAREKRTGLERRISIDQAVRRYGATELQQAKERIGALFGESGTDEAPEDAIDSDAIAALLEKTRARLDAVGDEDRQEMIDLMEAIRDAQASGDAAGLEQTRTQLTDLLFYLET